MHVQIRVDSGNTRRWLHDLKERLAARGHSCGFSASDHHAASTTIELLFELERLIYRLPGPRSSDRIDWRTLDGPPAATTEPALQLALLYDGSCSEAALHAALLDGRSPRVSIVAAATGA